MTVTVALGHVNELRASRAGEYRGHFGHGSLIMKQIWQRIFIRQVFR